MPIGFLIHLIVPDWINYNKETMDVVLPLTKQEAVDMLDILDMWIADNRETATKDPLEDMVWPQGRDTSNELFEEIVSLRERLRDRIVGDTFTIKKKKRRRPFNRSR